MMISTLPRVPLYNGKRCRYTEMLTLEDDGFQYELIEGVMLVNPAPFDNHQLLSVKLCSLIDHFLESHPIGIVRHAPRDVKLDERLTYQPDILFISNERRMISIPQYVEGAPDFVIEILSPGTFLKDTQEKFRDYEKYGVTEYWIMNPDDLLASQFYVLKQGKYQPVIPENGWVRSTMIEGFSIDLKLLEKKLRS